jgi:Na+-translocating ferredoxin:NAD+ oxidoreductase subunit B
MVSSPFYVESDLEKCEGCGECLNRCPMDALEILADGCAHPDHNRCIGCGLCVTTCPTGALSLTRKPDSLQREVPPDMVRLMIRLARSRGKLGALRMANIASRSAIDRVRAAIQN